jgi:hypothetical protein
MKNFLLFCIFIHKLIVFFLLFGWLLPIKYIHLHIIAVPIILVHWQLNNNKCIVTEIEHYLRCEVDNLPYELAENSPDVNTHVDNRDDFVLKLLKQLNINFNSKTIKKYVIVGLMISWSLSFYKFYKYKKQCKKIKNKKLVIW